MGDSDLHRKMVKVGGTMAKVIMDLKKSEQYVKVKESLVNQISDASGNIAEYYLDMIENYMALWTTAKALQLDIEKRGVTIKWDNGGGQKGVKKNDSIAELNKTIQQMTKLLESLGLKPTDLVSGSDGGEL